MGEHQLAARNRRDPERQHIRALELRNRELAEDDPEFIENHTQIEAWRAEQLAAKAAHIEQGTEDDQPREVVRD